jgi:hypothetical protein
MTEPLNGKDAMDLAVWVLIANWSSSNPGMPMKVDWEQIVRATLLRDRGDANGYLVSAVVKVEKRG